MLYIYRVAAKTKCFMSIVALAISDPLCLYFLCSIQRNRITMYFVYFLLLLY